MLSLQAFNKLKFNKNEIQGESFVGKDNVLNVISQIEQIGFILSLTSV